MASADVLVSYEGDFEEIRPALAAEGFRVLNVLLHVRCAVGRGGDLERLRRVPGVRALELSREVQVLDPNEE